MANRIIERLMHGPDKDGEPVVTSLAGTRAQSMQRLQIGLSGIAGIILMVALADTLSDRADRTDAVNVPETVTSAGPEAKPTAQSDPLAEAGVVPDLPADTAEAAAQDQPVLPEQGNAAQPGVGNNSGNALQN